MPLRTDLNKVLIIGSGPNIVGAVAELDLMTKQAIDAFVEDNVQVVLVNPNPATIATNKRPGVTIYMEPLTLSFMKRILRIEEPNAIVTAYGSLVGLNLTRQLLEDGILHEMHIELLTVTKKALLLQQQSQQLKFLRDNQLPTSKSWRLQKSVPLASTLKQLAYPVLLTKYHRYVKNDHLHFSDQASIAKYFDQEAASEHFNLHDYRITEDLSDWEEVIIDLVRDANGNNCFINLASSLEPVAINSGDSVLISPLLGFNNDEVQRLRACAGKVAANLDLVGALSIHFAIKHENNQIVIKILGFKPRIARSSLLAYRAGVYSLGYVTAKLALGYNLNEITDPESDLNAAVEPVLDAVAVKTPYWSFSDSGYNHYDLGPRMQASGEAISLGIDFSAAFFKGLYSTMSFTNAANVFKQEISKNDDEVIDDLRHPSEVHLIVLLAALARKISLQKIQAITNIQPLFLHSLDRAVEVMNQLVTSQVPPNSLLLAAKKVGLSDKTIAGLASMSAREIRQARQQAGIEPVYLQINGTAGIWQPKINAVYSAYDVEDEAGKQSSQNKVLLVGLYPFQVSQTSEFDFMLYQAAQTLKAQGRTAILLSNNAEAISAAYNAVDRVYFEPVTLENILDVAEREQITEVLTEFSGKKVNALRKQLVDAGLKILGQSDLTKPNWHAVTEPLTFSMPPALRTSDENKAYSFAVKVGFPVLIGGTSHQKQEQKSAVVFDMPALSKYIQENDLKTIRISKFIAGSKYEVAAISDGENVTIPGIIEHLEQSGSHASDSIAVFPPQNLRKTDEQSMRAATASLIKSKHLVGPINLNFLIADGHLYFLQLKTYAGHNLAFMSKVLNQDLVGLTTSILLGEKLPDLIKSDSWRLTNQLIYIKMPVSSWLNYHSGNTFDSKMKTAGNVIGRDPALSKALYKGYEASGLYVPTYGTIFISVKDKDKERATAIAKRFHRLGFKLIATEGTANMLAEAGITTDIVKKIHQGSDSLLSKLFNHQIKLVINVTDFSDAASQDAIRIRDQALSTHIPVFSSLQTAEFVLEVLESLSLTTQPI
ncbi:MAG: carbamoyl phosphate synthase large subunit [Lactobacillus sp.]|jgi:carbamoyl-phosphate synthase large subunit|nr:carbamoyl phosphate synthase large subunit [Lactobacillus sp.]MCI1481632.1 carbamoyl phosphate synthase large subunit [Lactobacillus sp.]